MNLLEARIIARRVERGELPVNFGHLAFDQVRAAFHRLDQSDPATPSLRREDIRLAKVIWAAAGKRAPEWPGLGDEVAA